MTLLKRLRHFIDVVYKAKYSDGRGVKCRVYKIADMFDCNQD